MYEKIARTKTQSLKSVNINLEGVTLNENTSANFTALMERYSTSDLMLQSIFWRQQLNASKLKIKVYTVASKWCLYLHHRFRVAYETLKKSGIIALPSGRTLRDYWHFVPSTTGFSVGVDRQLLDLVKQVKPSPSLGMYVSLLIAEMYIKEGLVFDNHYRYIGDINTYILIMKVVEITAPFSEIYTCFYG